MALRVESITEVTGCEYIIIPGVGDGKKDANDRNGFEVGLSIGLPVFCFVRVSSVGTLLG